MKFKPFSEFIEESPASDLSGDDLIPIVDGDSNVTGHTTVDDLASAIGGGGGEGGEVPASRTITAGTGLTGGGNLSANRTIALSEESIASLGLADSAVQSVVAGSNITINDADPANPVISSTGEGGGPVDWGDVENKPSFADVATSGDYDDLDNKPTLGTAAAASTSDFATAAQGSAADTALQPDDGLAALDAAAASKLGGIETGAEVNAVASVNGQTGAVSLDSEDVGAMPDDYVPGLDDLPPAGITLTVWHDGENWPASRPTASTGFSVVCCSIGDQGVPSWAIPGVDWLRILEEPELSWGNVLATYTFEGNTPDEALDDYPTDWTPVGTSTIFLATADAAVHGSLGGRIVNNGSPRLIRWEEEATTDDRVLDFYITPRAIDGLNYIAVIADDSTVRGDLRINANLTMSIRNINTAVATSSTALELDETYRVAWKVTEEGQELRVYEGEDTEALFAISGALTDNSHNHTRIGHITNVPGTENDFDTIRIGDDWLAPYA